MSTTWPVQIPMFVRERDCGPGDELDESSVLVFFREARRAYMSVLNAGDGYFRERLIDVRFEFHRVVSIDDDLSVRVRCSDLGKDQFTFHATVLDRVTGETVIEGYSTCVLVDLVGTPLGVPQPFRARVAALEGSSQEIRTAG